jgi:hypothetical protein
MVKNVIFSFKKIILDLKNIFLIFSMIKFDQIRQLLVPQIRIRSVEFEIHNEFDLNFEIRIQCF